MLRYQWSRLNKQQIGAYAEYFVKMEFTMYGFQVYETEIDDRGIDFITRFNDGPFLEMQVKSLRSFGYVFAQKDKFSLCENRFMAFVLFLDESPPSIFLIPSKEWEVENKLLVNRVYDGLKSKPEWGLNVSRKNMPILDQYGFEKTVDYICQKND